MAKTRDVGTLKKLARNAVNNALAQGKICKPDKCDTCGGPGPLQAHHWAGYAREHWFHISWDCRSCHDKKETPNEG